MQNFNTIMEPGDFYYKLWTGFFEKTDTIHLITHLVKFLPELSKIKADKNWWVLIK